MADLPQTLRGQAANLAAHSWAVSRSEKGLIVNSRDRAYRYAADGKTTVQMPTNCTSCAYSKLYFGDRHAFRPLVCGLGTIAKYKVGCASQTLRDVGRIQTCSAHTFQLPDD